MIDLLPWAWALLALAAVTIGISKTALPGGSILAIALFATVLPARLWEAMTLVLDQSDDPWDAEYEFVPLNLIETMVGPTGAMEPARAVTRADCPVAAELLRPLT